MLTLLTGMWSAWSAIAFFVSMYLSHLSLLPTERQDNAAPAQLDSGCGHVSLKACCTSSTKLSLYLVSEAHNVLALGFKLCICAYMISVQKHDLCPNMSSCSLPLFHSSALIKVHHSLPSLSFSMSFRLFSYFSLQCMQVEIQSRKKKEQLKSHRDSETQLSLESNFSSVTRLDHPRNIASCKHALSNKQTAHRPDLPEDVQLIQEKAKKKRLWIGKQMLCDYFVDVHFKCS